MAMVMGLAFLADNHSDVQPEVRYQHLQTFKELLVGRRPSTRCDPELFVKVYPESPANLPSILFQHAYGAAPPVVCPLTPFLVNFLKGFVPCRKTHASLQHAVGPGHLARGRLGFQPRCPTGQSLQASSAGPPHGAANPPSMGIIGMLCVEAAKQGVEIHPAQLSALAQSFHPMQRPEKTLPGLEVFRGPEHIGSPPRQRPGPAATFGQARLTISDSPRIDAATASFSTSATPKTAASAASQGCCFQGAAPVASPGSEPATPRTVASAASQGCFLHDGRPAASPEPASATLTRIASSASSQGSFQDGNAPEVSPGTAPALSGNAESGISPVTPFPEGSVDVTRPGASLGPIVAHGPPASQLPAFIADLPEGSAGLPGFMGDCRDLVAAAATKPRAAAKPGTAKTRRGAARPRTPLAPPPAPPARPCVSTLPPQHIVRRRVNGKSSAGGFDAAALPSTSSVVAALPGTSSAAAALILGCKRCRGSDNGCANSGKTKGCRDPAFKGDRGPQTKQAKTT